jgi:hypothetical protein
LKRCPEHADPKGDELSAWPGPDECRFFIGELNDRIGEVLAGMFIRVWTDENGDVYKQRFEKHQPVGDSVLWRKKEQL